MQLSEFILMSNIVLKKKAYGKENKFDTSKFSITDDLEEIIYNRQKYFLDTSKYIIHKNTSVSFF